MYEERRAVTWKWFGKLWIWLELFLKIALTEKVIQSLNSVDHQKFPSFCTTTKEVKCFSSLFTVISGSCINILADGLLFLHFFR